MKKILLILCCVLMIFSLVACGGESSSTGGGSRQDGTGSGRDDNPGQPSVDAMQIRISDGKIVIVFALNTSSAAKSLYSQLPFSITVSDYADNEKIFYPPNSLDTSSVTNAKGGTGVLAYFSPWSNIVMYYGSFGAYNGLYALGNATYGGENIKNVAGAISVEKYCVE